MKLRLLTLFIFLINIIVFGQQDAQKQVPKNFLGLWNDEPIYYTGLSHVQTNHINLYTVENSNLIPFSSISLKHEIFEQIFLYKDIIYAIVRDIDNTKLSLIQFDEELNEDQRIGIMSIKAKLDLSGRNTKEPTKFIFHDGKIAVTLSNRTISVAIIDLELMKSQSYTIKKNSTGADQHDVLFFNETDAHIIFTIHNELSLTYYYCVLKNGETELFELKKKIKSNDTKGKHHFSFFKFVHAENKNYLVSIANKKMGSEYSGIVMAEIKKLDIHELTLNLYINDKLDNPKLCGEQYYHAGKSSRNKFKFLNAELNDVFYSEGHLIFAIQNKSKESLISNIIISSLNISNPTKPFFEWNVCTHNGLFNSSYYHFNQYNHAYILAKTDDHLKLFYNCESSSLNNEGVVKIHKKERYPTLSIVAANTDVAVLDILLSNGAFSFENFPYRMSDKNPKRIIAPYYYQTNNSINFLLEPIPNIDYPLGTITKEKLAPVLIAFPID